VIDPDKTCGAPGRALGRGRPPQHRTHRARHPLSGHQLGIAPGDEGGRRAVPLMGRAAIWSGMTPLAAVALLWHAVCRDAVGMDRIFRTSAGNPQQPSAAGRPSPRATSFGPWPKEFWTRESSAPAAAWCSVHACEPGASGPAIHMLDVLSWRTLYSPNVRTVRLCGCTERTTTGEDE
jgi:hypothetical protein